MNDLYTFPDIHRPEGLLDGYLTAPELAGELGVSLRTLNRWHAQRTGPRRVTNGRLILYRATAVRDWLEARESQKAKPEPRSRGLSR